MAIDQIGSNALVANVIVAEDLDQSVTVAEITDGVVTTAKINNGVDVISSSKLTGALWQWFCWSVWEWTNEYLLIGGGDHWWI